MVRRAALAVAMILVASAGARAQSESETASLEGIAKFEVVVSNLEGAAADLGIRQGVLGSRLDARLREAGLPIADFGVAFLQLDVGAILLEAGPDIVLRTSLSFFQPAASTLNRWLGPARTWSRERLTVTGASRAEELLLRDVGELTETFIADWRAANPPAD